MIRGSKNNAVLYSNSNDCQVHFGTKLAINAEIRHGDKVLDMGCGTGELTACIAEMVGTQTQVIAVDPDVERIKVATHKHSNKNIHFIAGNSSSEFLHCNEQHYDVHFSNFVIQWLNPDEKEIFFKTAFKLLKPGGKIAILSHEGDHADAIYTAKRFLEDASNKLAVQKVPEYFLTKAEVEAVLRQTGFSIVYSEYIHSPYTFHNAEDFLSFLYASDYYDGSNIPQKKKNDLLKQIVSKNGTITEFDPTIYQIIAKKN